MTLRDALKSRSEDDNSCASRSERDGTGPEQPSPGGSPDELNATAKLTRYALCQSERTLVISTWIAIASTALLGVITALTADWFATATLFATAALLTPLFEVRHRCGHQTAGTLLIVSILVLVTVNMIHHNGIHNISILMYGTCLIMGGLILGKRSLWPLTFGCYASLALVTTLEMTGKVHSDVALNPDDPAIFTVLLAATALTVWVSIDNVERNFERIRRSEANGRLAYERTLEAWARALEYRDRETEGHSRRVTKLSVRLARELGLDESEITRIRWGALLHDIGKLAIPDHILLKPGPLTESEKALMRQHTIYAREMLNEIPFLRSVIDIPYYHHERWDGKGYPEGLSGEDIPRAARLFAIVDQWEALSSDRPYRRAWPREELISYMVRGAGTYFDPEILDVFLERICPDLRGRPRSEKTESHSENRAPRRRRRST